MISLNTKTASKKKRRTPAEIAQFAADAPAMPTLAPAGRARKARVARKLVVKLIEKVKGL
jgi:hypothetical protein